MDGYTLNVDPHLCTPPWPSVRVLRVSKLYIWALVDPEWGRWCSPMVCEVVFWRLILGRKRHWSRNILGECWRNNSRELSIRVKFKGIRAGDMDSGRYIKHSGKDITSGHLQWLSSWRDYGKWAMGALVRTQQRNASEPAAWCFPHGVVWAIFEQPQCSGEHVLGLRDCQ